ncbi:MAG: DUF3617 family protein [Geobacteraceae bacterium]|jgi:uncharacterized protein YceK
MKHGVWSFTLVAVLVFSLALVGCSRKKESETPSAPAPEQKAAAASVNMKEGQWEITTTVDMPGMPAAAMKPHTVTSCLSKKDYVPKANPEQGDCKLVDQKIDGNTVSWGVACKDSSGKGSITYAGDSFSGLMETTMKQGEKEMTVKMKMDGKRIGDCPQQ